MSYTCVECGGRLVLDCKTGYYVCSNCGLVHELAVYDRTFYEEEPRPMRQDYKVRAMERRINRLMLRLFGAPRTREVEWFLSKLKELHPELSSLIDEIEASSVRRAARIAYQRLGIPYGDIKEAIRRAHLKVDVRLKELGPPRPRRRVKLEGRVGEETRRMRRIIGKIFLAGIPESKDAVAYILACRRLGLKIEPERAARIYGVSVKLVKKRLREIRRILKNNGVLILTTPNNTPVYTYLDPAYWVTGHRHYETAHLRKLLKKTGFKITRLFTAGGTWTCINNLVYCLLIYPLKTVLEKTMKKKLDIYTPLPLQWLDDKTYSKTTAKGYTIFIKARK